MKQVALCASIAMSFLLVGCNNSTPTSPDQLGKRSEKTSDSVMTTVEAPAVPEIQESLVNTQLIRVQEMAGRENDQVIGHAIDKASVESYQFTRQSKSASQPMMLQAEPQYQIPRHQDREKYIHFDENPIHLVSRDPVSTFSVDVDTASYSNVRRMIQREGRLPPQDAVKVEEMINYFSYDYPVPESQDKPFSINTEIAKSPWNADKYLLQIGLKGFEPNWSTRPDANLVFLIDVSGSMMDQNKLPLVKQSLKLLVNQMSPTDRIALVVYAGAAGLVLDSTEAKNKLKISQAIDQLQAGGSTNGGAGLDLAYSVAQQYFVEGGINRVLIASDGDMNVGIADHEMLKDKIELKRRSGIALTTLGFGSGNYNDALMEQLADVGNGNAAYIDSISEAQKVLVNEMHSTLLTIAKDVKVQVEFNPQWVSQYRLVGYENRVLNQEDFRNDKVDAGEIGAGHTVTAFYEVTLVGSEDNLLPNLRYQTELDRNPELKKSPEIAYVNLRYKAPNSRQSKEFGEAVLTSSLINELASASDNLRFAAAVAGFGQILKGGKYTADWKLQQVADLARQARGQDNHGYRGEFIRLVELTQSMGLEWKNKEG